MVTRLTCCGGTADTNGGDVADEFVGDRGADDSILLEDSRGGAVLQRLDAGEIVLDNVDRASRVDTLGERNADKVLVDLHGCRSHREGESEDGEERGLEHHD